MEEIEVHEHEVVKAWGGQDVATKNGWKAVRDGCNRFTGRSQRTMNE